MNVYDFDGTIYDGDSSVDFYFFSLKKRTSLLRFFPKQVWGFVLYGFKRISKTEFKERFFSFLSGIDAEKFVNDFWAVHTDKIYNWYLRQQRQDDIVISASPEFLLQPACDALGIRYLIASKVDEQSGRFIGENCRGEEKVRRLKAEYQVTHIDNFYSDSLADQPLAAIADKAFIVKNGTVFEWSRKK